jgi:glycosyltransferase involved in cell wall biosynthesis
MKILYLNHNVVGRSTFHRCFFFAREVVKKGHEVTLLTNSEKKKLRFIQYKRDNVNIVETPDLFWGSLRTGWDPINVIKRCFYIRNKTFDLVHAFDTRPTVILPALFYQKFVRKVPLIIDWADWWGRGGAIVYRPNKILNNFFSPVETFFEEYFRGFADFTTVTSNRLKERAIKLGINKTKIRVIFSGADVTGIISIKKNAARKKINIPLKEKIVIFSGFVLYDLKLILEAFRLIAGKRKEIKLYLVGSYPNCLGEPYDHFIRLGQIKLVGKVDRMELNYYLSSSDVSILPLSDSIANQARFPIKFGDYIASGVPLITNNVGDIGRIVKKNDIAFLSKYNPYDLAKKIVWVINHLTLAQKKALSARRFAEREFSWKVIASDLLDIYKSYIE